MDQLATEGGGLQPRGFGMPAVDANNKKTYVYDIDHRNDLCIANVRPMDLLSTPVANLDTCPVATGAQVSSVTGGAVVGYDMYGQYITETVGAAGTSDTCFYSVVSAPADALWTNTFGLPYTHASSTDGVPADVAYIAPANLNKRGAYTYAGADEVVQLSYTVNRVNMFGDARPDLASTAAIAEETFAATLEQATGVVSITATLVADDSDTVTYTFPDGTTAVVGNVAVPIVHTLSPLFMSQYGRQAMGDQNLDGLIRGVTANGTSIKVNITGTVAPVAVSDPAPAPASDPAPEALPEPYNFTSHAQANEWLDAFTTALGIGEPLDWTDQSLTEKKASAQALYDAHQ